MQCDPGELQVVKDALNRDSTNLGVGILHVPSGHIHLIPFDSLPMRGGHAEFAGLLHLPLDQCRGFVIATQPAGFLVSNMSHLNGPQGQPGSLQMPAPLFADIVQALQDEGL